MTMTRHGSKSFTTAFCLFASLFASTAFGLDSAKIAQAKYDALKAKVESGDLNIDWRDLRIDAVVAGVNREFDWRKANSEGVAAFNAGDYQRGLLKAQEMIQHNIANGDGHFLAMVAWKHLGKQEEAARENSSSTK
jgi:hypothetical protein